MTCRAARGVAPEGVPITKMECGDLGEILMWSGNVATPYRGQVVQRNQNRIITIGEPDGKSFSSVLNTAPNEGCRVRILRPGDTIQIMRPDEGN